MNNSNGKGEGQALSLVSRETFNPQEPPACRR